MAPVPRVKGAVVRVQAVQPGVLHEPDHGDALVQAAAPLHIVLPRQDASVQPGHFAGGAVPHQHGEILPTGPLDARDHLGGDSEPVLQAAAVLVVPVVIIGDGELVQQIALVDGVQLHAVAAGLPGQLRAADHDVHQLSDLRHGKGAVLHLGCEHIGHFAGRDHGPLIIKVGQGGAKAGAEAPAHAGAELENQLGPGGLMKLPQRAAENVRRLVQPAGPAPFVGEQAQAGDDEPHPVFRAVEEKTAGRLIKPPVFHRRGPAHGAQDNAVRHGQGADAQRIIFMVGFVVRHINAPPGRSPPARACRTPGRPPWPGFRGDIR